MTDKIRVERVRPALKKVEDTWAGALTNEMEEFAALRPWVQSLHKAIGGELSEEVLGELVQKLSAPVAEEDPFETAVQLARENAGLCGQTALFLALFYLKRQGFEVGSSPAQHWRLNRLLNAGSKALDVMLESRSLRQVCLKTVLFRMAKSAMAQGRNTPVGAVAELNCSVRWNVAEDETLKRTMPPRAASDRELGEGVVDWLLEELLSRGLSSLTLGSVIEESRQGRKYRVSEFVAEKVGSLGANEGRFLVGAVFLPARIGGWELSEEEEMLDAFAMAREISSDFVPEEEKVERYGELLRWVRAQRRSELKEQLSWRVEEGGERRTGCWGLRVHPVRRDVAGSKGFFALETGFFFEEVSKSAPGAGKGLLSRLRELAQEEDEEAFGAFAQALDEVVYRINHMPGTVEGENARLRAILRAPSPLWANFYEGAMELRQFIDDSDDEALKSALRRWTLPLKA